MDIITNITATSTPNSTAIKSPELECETPTRIQQPVTNTKFNGVLKRHQPNHRDLQPINQQPPAAPFTFKECLKNHAAGLGGHAVDGCGEFMASPDVTSGDPSSLKCAACGCHRNFHRREPDDQPIFTTQVIEYQSLHRHHPQPPLPFSNRSHNSASPPPISSSYYPSTPHMLLALSAGGGIPVQPENTAAPMNTVMVNSVPSSNPSRKRFRTKFTQDQKMRMHQFAESVGWKMQKKDKDAARNFCNEIGVERTVLKVWMHNNKNTFGKKLDANGGNDNGRNSSIIPETARNGGDDNNGSGGAEDQNQYQNDSGVNVGANGSSSSS